MPISTSLPSQNSPQDRQSNSRWSSSDERIDADQRRRSLSAMQELDGTALYDRPDWPLRSPSPPSDDDDPSSPHVDHAKSLVHHGVTDASDEHVVDDNAGLRRPVEIGGGFDGSAYFAHSDVSDIEEETEESEDERDLSEPSTSRDIPSGEYSPVAAKESEERTPYRESLVRPRYAQAEVSPVRETSTSESGGQMLGTIPHQSQHQQEAFQVAPLRPEMDTAEENDVGNPSDISSNTPSADDSPNPQNQQQQGPPSIVSTPTLVSDSASWSPPRPNGTGWRSSIIKGPVPNRRASVRSSWISPTQIPHNNNRVRYSWQSLQDDEPNRPRIHIIKLVSNTVTASAGFPTGEAFGFSISPGGRRIAAFNSARLYVLQTNALPVGISQDYALKRRPLAVEVTDEGNTMAVLADDHTVNIYDFGLSLKRTRTIKLDFPTNCIALAPTGGLLAAAYEGGVEVFSLAASALETDRRAVRSPRMDRLSFSPDGSTLLGTTTRINVSSTVVVSVPVFPAAADGMPTHEELKEAWCSELLHPENIRNSSHATFMREDRQIINERVFAWNGLEDTFGILNVSDMHYGSIDFPVVISPPLSTCGGLGAAIHSCPAIDEDGDTVAMIVNDRTIRLYIVPHGVDENASNVEAHSIDHELDEGYGCPFHEVRWVHSAATLPAPSTSQNPVKGRLIVTSPGGVVESGISEESVEDIEGGRIIMFDFDPQFAGQPGQTFNLTLGKSPPQTLEEEQVNVAEQVALVRRRTVNQSKGLSQRPTQLGRAATTYGGRSLRSPSPALTNTLGALRPNRASMLSIGSMHSEAARSLPDLAEGNESGEGVEAFEEPYVQGAPRSQASLQRAASNAQRHRFQTIEERQQERVSSDSHGNFLALPEYTEEPNAPLPSRYRAMAGLDVPKVFNAVKGSSLSPISSATGSSSTAPHTAPPDVGENFSADLAFQAANAQFTAARGADEQQGTSSIVPTPETTPTTASRQEPDALSFAPPQRGAHGTFDSINAPLSGPLIQERSVGSMHRGYSSALGSYAVGTAFSDTGSNAPPSTSISNGIHDVYDPPGRAGTFDSVASLPRSLQRAYSNAVSPMAGPPPNLIGDWRNVAPATGSVPDNSRSGSIRSLHARPNYSSASNAVEERWDMVSPVPPSARPGPAGSAPYRYSASLQNGGGRVVSPMYRAPSSAGSFTTTIEPLRSPSSAGELRMPANMHTFRQAAASNPSASLFPPNQAPDHVPIRQTTTRAGTAGHPITGWRPPVPSASASTPHLHTSGSLRRHQSRRSSLAGKSGFTSTAKAKKFGFFKRSKRLDPYAPSSYSRQEGGSVFETKSMFTTFTRGEGRCSVM